MSNQEKYAEKIAKLLAKAESSTFEAERDAFIAAAQNLMTRYAISEAMIDSARGIERDEIEQETFKLTGVFRESVGELLWAIASSNNCRAVLMPDMRIRDEDGKTKLTLQYTLTGFRSDLDRVKLLFSSLQIQAASAQAAWAKTDIPAW